MNSAVRHIRRARRNTGRILVAALGFGTAYFFDPENGAPRRERLRRSMRRAAATFEVVVGQEVEEPPPAFHPLLRGLGAEKYESTTSRPSAAS